MRRLFCLITITLLIGCGTAFAGTRAKLFDALLASQRASGVTLAGGKAYFYTPGTTSLKTIYSSQNKTVAANPVTLDANGQARVYGDGLYDVQVQNSTLSVSLPLWEDVRLTDGSENLTWIDQYDSLAAAVTAIGSTKTTLYIGTNQTLAGNLTIPSTLELVLVNGATITTTGYTLTINGPFNPGNVQVFAGSGTIAGLDEARPEWWPLGDVDDSSSLQAMFNSGASVIKLGRIYRGDNLTVPTTVKHIQGVGHSISGIHGVTNSNDILTVATLGNYMKLERFHLYHTTKGTGDGLVLTSNNHNIVIEQITVSNCDIGFNAKNVAWLQKYVQCRANDCNKAFFAEGRTTSNTGAGTTIIYDQCYAVRPTTWGFKTQYIAEVIYINPAIDQMELYGIIAGGNSITRIVGLHTENNPAVADGGAVIWVTGATNQHVSIDGMFIQSSTTSGTDISAIKIDGTPSGFNLEATGLYATDSTKIKAFSIVETALHPGKYVSKMAQGFDLADIKTLTGGGKFYENIIYPGASGSASVANGAYYDTGLGRYPLYVMVQVVPATDAIPTVGAAVTDVLTDGRFKVKYFKLADGTADTGTYTIHWQAY